MIFIPMFDEHLLAFLQFRIRMCSEAKSKSGANSTTLLTVRCIRWWVTVRFSYYTLRKRDHFKAPS